MLQNGALYKLLTQRLEDFFSASKTQYTKRLYPGTQPRQKGGGGSNSTAVLLKWPRADKWKLVL